MLGRESISIKLRGEVMLGGESIGMKVQRSDHAWR